MSLTSNSDDTLRVYELAKELRLDSRRLIDLLQRLKIQGIHNHMSSVPPQAAQQVREIMQGKLPPEPASSSLSTVHESKRERRIRRLVHDMESLRSEIERIPEPRDTSSRQKQIWHFMKEVANVVGGNTEPLPDNLHELWNRMLQINDRLTEHHHALASVDLSTALGHATTVLHDIHDMGDIVQISDEPLLNEARKSAKVLRVALEHFQYRNQDRDMALDRHASETLRALSRKVKILTSSQKTDQPLAKQQKGQSTEQAMREVERCLNGKGYLVDASTWMRWYESGRVVCNEWAMLESRRVAHQTVQRKRQAVTLSNLPYWLDSSTAFKTYKTPGLLAKALITFLDSAAPSSKGHDVGRRSIPNLFVAQTLKIDVSKLSVNNIWDRIMLDHYRTHYMHKAESLPQTVPEGRPLQESFPDWRSAIMHYENPSLLPEEKVRLSIVYQKSVAALEHSTKTPPLEGWKSPVGYSYLANLGWLSYRVTAEFHAWGRFHIWTDHGELDFTLHEYIEPSSDTELIVLAWAFSVLEGLRCDYTSFAAEGYRPRSKLMLHKSGTHSPKAHRRFKNSSRSRVRHTSEPRYMKAHLSSPTLVRGHTVDLKGRKQPSAEQVELARLYRIHVEPGHTFRRPHPRGAKKEGLQWHISWDANAVIHELPDIGQVRNNPDNLSRSE